MTQMWATFVHRHPVAFAVLRKIGVVLVAVVICYALLSNIYLLILGILGLSAIIGALLLISIGLYRQLLIFFALLLLFTFSTKFGYGIINSTLLALPPTAFLGFMIVQLFLLAAEGKLRLRWISLDFVVIAFFMLDLIQVLNPYLDIFSDKQYLIIGLRGFWQRSFMLLVYCLVRVLIRSEQRFNTVAMIFAYSIALSGLYALTQQLFGFDILESRYREYQIADNPLGVALYTLRSTGFLGSPFTFGMVSAMGIWCGIYLLRSNASKQRQLFLIIMSLVINAMALMLSSSRSSYLAIIVSVVVVAIVNWKWWLVFVWRARRVITIFIMLMMVLVALFYDSPPVQFSIDRIGTVTQLLWALSGQEVEDRNFLARKDLAAATWPLILENPLGYGSGIFTGGANSEGLVRVKGYATWVDNEFSSLALEMGILGVGLLLLMIGMALWRCKQAVRLNIFREQAVALSALVVICPAAGFGGQWLAAYPANILFWVFLGCIANLPFTNFAFIDQKARQNVKHRHRQLECR